MRVWRKSVSAALFLLFLLPGTLSRAAGPDSPAGGGQGRRSDIPHVIRIAVPYYDDFYKTYIDYEKLFHQGRAAELYPSAIVKVVVGTYDEVLHWYQSDQVDMAMLPPGPLADLLTPADKEKRKKVREGLESLYVATRALKPSAEGRQPFMSDEDRAQERRFGYRARFVVRKQEGPAVPAVRNFDDLVALASAGKVKFLFVHPLSVAGRILPEYLLRSRGVRLNPDDIEWTYSHQLSLKMLDKDNTGKIRVAFVWDAVTLSDKPADPLLGKGIDADKLEWFPLPDEQMTIPQDVLVVTSKFKNQYPLLNVKALLFGGDSNTAPEFERREDWLTGLASLEQWTAYLKAHPPQGQRVSDRLTAPSVSLDHIVARLRNYNEAHSSDPDPHPVRLAVVLSGGGAKCAYQIGVVEALESRLKLLQPELPDHGSSGIDIDLVVGTSGGAINALAVALGLTRDEEGRRQLRDTWHSFTQKDFFQLWPRVDIAFGVSLGLLQAALVIIICMLTARWRDQWWTVGSYSILAITAVNLFLAKSSWTPLEALGSYGRSHLLHHLWLIVTVSIWWTTLSLFMIGGTLLMLGRRMIPLDDSSVREEMALIVHRRKIAVAALVMVGLSQALWMTFLFRESALSDSTTFKEVLARKFAGMLVKGERSHDDTGDKLQDLSRQIIMRSQSDPNVRRVMSRGRERRVLERDLIITGSRLQMTDEVTAAADGEHAAGELPTDLYFYFARDQSKQTPDEEFPPDRRFIPLAAEKNRPLLLDIVVGSSTIFPLFLPQELCVQRAPGATCQKMQLIDGGFIHNSPIEAAIKWGATHIIVVEASPWEPPTLQMGLVDNSMVAFNYLFAQAQNLDARAYGQKEIYIIRPRANREGEDRNLDTFDFSGHLVSMAIDKGLNDALNLSQPRFQRVFTNPTF